MRRIVVAVTLIFCLSVPTLVGAGPLEDARRAEKRNDNKTAFRIYKRLAESGNADAQDSLANMYWSGRGVPQDYEAAVKWQRRAAEGGNPGAQWMMGGYYEYGKHVPKDLSESIRWYRRAANQGYGYAQKELAYLYERGEGIPQNYVLAHMWYNLASVNIVVKPESAIDEFTIEFCVDGRDRVAAQMTPAQIAEAQKLAREWKPKKEK